MPTLAVPRDFNLRSTVLSHGWSTLGPFDADHAGERLQIRLAKGPVTVRQRGTRLVITGTDSVAAVRACLQPELDLSDFWALAATDPNLKWAAEEKAGRMLRAPTAWGDALMVLATTNCSWALTVRMVKTLIARWGRNGALPSQKTIAKRTERELRGAGWGYRAPYLEDLARGPNLEALRKDKRPTSELRKHLLSLPGFGPYAAETMLKLLGRFEHLALDSWVTRVWKEKFPRRKPTESAIRRRLSRYGPWTGLAFFLIVTSDRYAGA